VHPLLAHLDLPAEQRDKRGQLKVTLTPQLPAFADVFAGGDCAIDSEKPLPAVAQVAYQQGYAIARNLKALEEGRPPIAAQVRLRGTLMKLGLGEGAAELYDRYEVKGHFGHLLRQVRYLELLPTPCTTSRRPPSS
jgi:NADH dehydrogenase